MKNNDKKLLLSLTFFTLSIVVAGFLYGGLTINKLKTENSDLVTRSEALENKFVDLQNKVIDSANQIAAMTSNLDKTKNDLAYYKKLALAPKPETTPEPQATAQPLEVVPVIKTVTEKVYVEKETQETTVTIENLGSYKVTYKSGDTAYKALKRTSEENGFPLEYEVYDFGVFVTSIGGIEATGNQYWAFYYNGTFSQVGASDQKLKNGDTTFWRLESF